MKSYANGGLQGRLSTTNNFGTRVLVNTKIINTSYTNAENIRFTFGSTAIGFTFEVTWYEFNVFNNGTQWTWWGDFGGWINSSGAWNGRFGVTTRGQQGANNGTGFLSGTTNSISWNSRTFAPTQNISSIYFVVHCDRWDAVTINYF